MHIYVEFNVYMHTDVYPSIYLKMFVHKKIISFVLWLISVLYSVLGTTAQLQSIILKECICYNLVRQKECMRTKANIPHQAQVLTCKFLRWDFLGFECESWLYWTAVALSLPLSLARLHYRLHIIAWKSLFNIVHCMESSDPDRYLCTTNESDNKNCQLKSIRQQALVS